MINTLKYNFVLTLKMISKSHLKGLANLVVYNPFINLVLIFIVFEDLLKMIFFQLMKNRLRL